MTGPEKLEEMQASIAKLSRREAMLGPILALKQAEIVYRPELGELKEWLGMGLESLMRLLGDTKAEKKKIVQLHDDRLKVLGVLPEPTETPTGQGRQQ